MKIGKGLLKKVTEDSLGTQELYSESTYQHIAILYNEAVTRHTNLRIWFVPPLLGEEKKQKKFEQIRKFIDLCVEFEIPFEVAMEHQIKVLVKFIREKNLAMKYPPFAMLVSENSRKRFGYIKDAIKRRYTGSARIQELFRVQFLDIEKSLRDSMEKVYARFKKETESPHGLSKYTAVRELEIMARAKLISNVYVYSSPLNESTMFLRETRDDASQRLSERQKEAITQIKEELKNEFKNGEILKWV